MFQFTENDKKKAIENPADSSAYRYGIKFVYGAASLVSNMADGGKTNRKLIKQLRIELDESKKKCDELERQTNNLKVSRVDDYFCAFILCSAYEHKIS